MGHIEYNRFFKEMLNLFPSMGSYLGYRKYDNRYEDCFSREVTDSWKMLIEKYQRRVRSSYNSHDDTDLQDKSFQWFLSSELHRVHDLTLLIPISSFNNQVISMVFHNKTFYTYKTKSDLDNLIRRYKGMIEVIKSCISRMKEGIDSSIVLPRIICQATLSDLKEFHKKKDYIVDLPTKFKHSSSFFVILRQYDVVIDRFGQTLLDLITFIEKVYLPKGRSTLGVCHLPGGKSYYEKLLVAKTTLKVTPTEVFDYGKQEVLRLRKEFDKLKHQLGYAHLDHLKFCDKIISDPNNYAKSVNELMTYYDKQKKRIASTVMKDKFHTSLKHNYDIKAVPRDLEVSAAGAFYYTGNYKNRKGTFYLNTRDLWENPLYTAYVLSLHEGQPGHHYQFQYMIEKRIPESNVFAFNAEGFAEGWGLYVENLGDYTPLEYFGKLTYEILRAVRLVVDVGIHYYGWSWEKALKYMVTNIPVKKSEIETELMRYICLPAQACSYKMGERLFKQLGEAFVKGKKGTIKDYHEAVLKHGVLPLEVLKEHFKREYKIVV